MEKNVFQKSEAAFEKSISPNSEYIIDRTGFDDKAWKINHKSGFRKSALKNKTSVFLWFTGDWKG